MTVTQKCKKRDAFRYALKTRVRNLPKQRQEQLCLLYVERLHDFPSEFRAAFPDAYRSVFSLIGEPVAAQVDLDVLDEIANSFPCRGGDRGDRGVGSGSGHAVARPSDQMAQMFGVMMDGLKRAGEQQQRMFERIVGPPESRHTHSLQSQLQPE